MKITRLILKIVTRREKLNQQLNLAVVEKERALTAKSLMEAKSSRLESLRKSAAAFGFGYGLLVVFCYCFFDLKFFPSGLTTGDVLFFLFAALGLGLMSLLCVAFGVTLFMPVVFFEGVLPPSVGNVTKHEKFANRLWFTCPAVVVLLVFIYTESPSLWLAIACAMVLTLWCMAIIYKGLELSKAQGKARKWSDAVVETLGYVIFAPFVCFVLISLGKAGWYLLSAIAVAGMAAALGISLLDTRLSVASMPSHIASQKRSTRLIVVKILFIFALLPGVVSPVVRLAVFTKLGVRTEDTAINVDKANLAILRSAASTAGLYLSVCRGEEGSAVVGPINVLWHAAGARSLVQLGDSLVDLELNSSGLKLLRGPVERCVEINEAILFDSGSVNLITDSVKAQKALSDELSPLLKKIGKKWKVKSVTVVGHADPMPLPGNGNNILAQNRADLVKEMLLKIKEIKNSSSEKVEFKAISDGSRSPIKQCSSKETIAFQRICNEVNRRVEVRFRLERQPTTL